MIAIAYVRSVRATSPPLLISKGTIVALLLLLLLPFVAVNINIFTPGRPAGAFLVSYFIKAIESPFKQNIYISEVASAPFSPSTHRVTGSRTPTPTAIDHSPFSILHSSFFLPLTIGFRLEALVLLFRRAPGLPFLIQHLAQVAEDHVLVVQPQRGPVAVLWIREDAVDKSSGGGGGGGVVGRRVGEGRATTSIRPCDNVTSHGNMTRVRQGRSDNNHLDCSPPPIDQTVVLSF